MLRSILTIVILLITQLGIRAEVVVRLSALSRILPSGWEIDQIEDNALPKDYQHDDVRLPRGLSIMLKGPLYQGDIVKRNPEEYARIHLWFMPTSFDESALSDKDKAQSQAGPANYMGKNSKFKLFIKSYYNDNWKTHDTDISKCLGIIDEKR